MLCFPKVVHPLSFTYALHYMCAICKHTKDVFLLIKYIRAAGSIRNGLISFAALQFYSELFV